MTENSTNEKVMIEVSGLRKKYHLGKIGAATLQGTIKEWRENRKNRSLTDNLRHQDKKSPLYSLDGIIEFAGLGDFIDTPVKRYSSGMFVKLGFSVAIHLESELVIMDEVLAVGDMEFQNKCLDRLTSIANNEKRTVLYVSHNMNTVRRLCDRCIVLNEGKIIYDGDTEAAIALYLGAGGCMPNEIEFGPKHRPNDHLIRLKKKFTLERLRLLTRPEPSFLSTEAADLELTCTAETDLERVGFRFELSYQDGSKVGSMLSGNFLDLPRGKSRLWIRVPFAHLASGQYWADIVAFQFDESGSEYMIDAVYPGFQFRIKQTLDEINYLDWHHKYWGVVRLEDLRLTRFLLPDAGLQLSPAPLN